MRWVSTRSKFRKEQDRFEPRDLRFSMRRGQAMSAAEAHLPCAAGFRRLVHRRLHPRMKRQLRREQVERAEKKELVTTLNKVFQTTGVVVVAHNKGLTVNQVNDLRGKMAQAGAKIGRA